MSTPAKSAVFLCLAVGIFFAGYTANRQPAPVASSTSAKQVLYYTCPMHPHYKSDRPGDAPCCGMRLEPVYAGSQPGHSETALPDGAVEISPVKQQLIGVRTDEVKKAAPSHLLRLPARVAVDDSRLYRIIAASDGWIRELGPNPAGTFVKKDDLLASYYVREFLAAQQTLFYTFSTADVVQRGAVLSGGNRAPTDLNLQRAIDALRSLGMSDGQIEQVRKTRQYASAIHIYSPASGFVIARDVTRDQRFNQGTELYRIADIRHVWVVTDIFEKDSEFLRPGAMATVHYQGRRLPARMSDALPQFDPQSRILKTRFELDNPGNLLRPDMFVDVELQVRANDAVTVPADAVIDSGVRKTVFVERASGVFEPRLVETGWRLGGQVQITKGLEPGERIVVSGNFLIDSESRMKAAAAGHGAAADHSPVRPAAANKAELAKDPVCGMDVDPRSDGVIKSQHEGRTYYFCSDHCKKSFAAEPGKYLAPKQAAPGKRGTA